MEKIVEFKNINFAYNGNAAFNDFSMEIEKGDFVTMIGTSGSGKTTLLKMLCHCLPNAGIYYKGQKVDSYKTEDLQKEIVVIFDTPILNKTAHLELKRFITKIGLNQEDIANRIDEFVKTFNMESYINKAIKELTREELYMIKILRYLIIVPEFLAIDSILSCVSKANRDKIVAFIKRHEITCLNVTADLDDSLYGNKLFVLENFVLILEGSTMSVLKTDTLLKRLGFKLPLAVDLSIELIHYDVLKKIYTEKEKLVAALWK